MNDRLEFLLALAKEQHFGRAAEACGVTQPSFSAAIKQLEAQHGVLLVNRGSRFIGFTPEGQRMLDWARRIVGDTRAMHDEMRALQRGLAGHLRIAAVPTALSVIARLTTPLRDAHPGMAFTVLSRTSVDVLGLLENLEVDAGITYIDNEPLGRVRAVPLFHERYRLLTGDGGPFAARAAVEWGELGPIPLCLLISDMQNRRIIDRKLRDAGAEPLVALQSNSMVVLLSHVQTGRWASVMPSVLAEMLGVTERIRSIPIVDAGPEPVIGLVYPQREPLTPQTAALVAQARRLAEAMADIR